VKEAKIGGISMGALAADETVEGALVLCARCADQPTPAAGSSRTRCGGCGEEVWIHSSTVRAAPNSKVTCLECMLEKIRKETDN